MNPTISFAGLTFQGDMVADGFAVERLMGWYDAAPVRSEVDDNPSGDGAFDVDRVFRGARVISVEGDWVGPDMTAAYQAREQIAAMQSDGTPSLFTVTDPLGVRSCMVTLHKEAVVDDVLRAPFFQYSFDLVARDPRKYGPEVSDTTGLGTPGTGYVWPAEWPAEWGVAGDPSRASVTNAGTALSWPVLEVVGGLSDGFELVEIQTGAVLRLERLIPEGGKVFLDARTMRAYLDTPTNDITGFLTRRDWWPVPAGATRTVQFNALGTVSGIPQLTVRVSPAY